MASVMVIGGETFSINGVRDWPFNGSFFSARCRCGFGENYQPSPCLAELELPSITFCIRREHKLADTGIGPRIQGRGTGKEFRITTSKTARGKI